MTATSRPDCPRHPGSSSSGQRDEHRLKSPADDRRWLPAVRGSLEGSQDLGSTRQTGIEDLTVSPRRVPASSWRRRPTATVPLAPGRVAGLTADATSSLQSCFRRSTSIPADWASDSLSADLEHAAGSGAGRVSSPARSAPLAARCGSERRSGRRRAAEICGSRNRSGNCRWRLPCIHENAVLRVSRLDNERADDGSRPVGGENGGSWLPAVRDA